MNKGACPFDPRLPNALEEERSGQIFGLTETPLGQIRRPKGCLYFELMGAARRVRLESFCPSFFKKRARSRDDVLSGEITKRFLHLVQICFAVNK